ncbi:hypothetical protein SAMN05216529_11441 [Faecalicatena contorta]|uniref:Uncharacterized protein n=1 Tax=Faecalicatena contorta TaxID=39482 RepID=A0A315ZR63_9FIRM|nr:hypothetical protein A8805_11441 [Faecalicatena contorta]SUQ15592.1 hypothetical protein SAMN05216529_11441 [Faecalicatena contorta]
MARKSRTNITDLTKAKSRVWLIAIYIRLSREDNRTYDESESVTNQRAIMLLAAGMPLSWPPPFHQ